MVWLGNRLDGIFGSERRGDIGNLDLNIIPRRFDFVGRFFRRGTLSASVLEKGTGGQEAGTWAGGRMRA